MKTASLGQTVQGGGFLRKNVYLRAALAGVSAGAVTGLLGAGGGMVLVPLLTLLTPIPEDAVFPTSVSIILPICAVTLAVTAALGAVDWAVAAPYLIGSGLGGFLAGKFGKNLPVVWLHRILGIFILWGGVRYLC